MRLITRHIYRAFPELDHFSDDQCRRFVQVAARGAIHRGIRYVLTALAWWIVALAILVWVDYIYIRIDFDPYATQSVFLSVVSTIVPAAIGMFAASQCALGVRDSLLRRSVRRVVNSRGRCHDCDYVLLGLPVGSDLKVRCPECGQDVEVDPSLGELVSGHSGAPVFRPLDDRFDPAAMARRTRRRRRIIGWGVSAAAIIIGVPLFVVGAWLYDLHQQATRAAAARVTYGQLAAVVAKAYPADMDVPPDPESYLPELIGAQAHRAIRSAVDEVSAQYGDKIYVGIRCYRPVSVPVPGTKPEIIALQQREREASRIAAGVVIDKLRSTGWMQRAEILPSVRRTGWIRGQSSVKLISRDDLSETAYFIEGIARVSFARMQFASEAEDTEEYAAALEQALAAARLAAKEPAAECWRTAASIETITMSIVRNHLREPRSAQWVERVRKVLVEHEPVSAMPLFDAYVLVARDQIAEFFSNVWDVCDHMSGRQRFWSAYVFVAGDVQYVGSLEENLLEVDRLAEKWKARIEMEPWQITEPPPQSEKRLAPVSWAFPFSAMMDSYAGERMLTRRGVEIMLAIESFRQHHGQYPWTLDELLSEGVSADTLRDPYSGRNFGYCLADPGTDPLNRAYLLWSVGYDKTDNGGTLHPKGKSSFALDRWNSDGSDYIINQPE